MAGSKEEGASDIEQGGRYLFVSRSPPGLSGNPISRWECHSNCVQLELLLFIFCGLSVMTGFAACTDSDRAHPSHARFVFLVVASVLNWFCFVVWYVLYYRLLPLSKHPRCRHEHPEEEDLRRRQVHHLA